MAFVLTDHHLELANRSGTVHAYSEILLGNTAPNEPVLDEEDQRSVVFSVTGAKLALDSDEAREIISAYEDGYFEGWGE